MALYVITDGEGDDSAVVLSGIDAVKEKLKEWYKDGIYSFKDGDAPDIYKLEKKMTYSIKTVVELKGE